MDKTTHGWNVFDAQTPILTYQYSFGPGTANALAVGGSGGLFVISPPCKAEDGVIADLAQFGSVRGLIAPNAFHHMGLASWHARLPEAALYAPAQSVARVQRQSGLRGIQPLAAAQALAGPRLELIDMPFYKTGEALIRMHSTHGLAWYVTDVIMNMDVLPANPVARLVFTLSRSAPGLRFNNVAPLFMVKDKTALRRWIAEEAAKNPPRWIIAAHGAIADLEADPGAARRLFPAV